MAPKDIHILISEMHACYLNMAKESLQLSVRETEQKRDKF
jgi:hypothetical protein